MQCVTFDSDHWLPNRKQVSCSACETQGPSLMRRAMREYVQLPGAVA
jgi:hypothetical protein